MVIDVYLVRFWYRSQLCWLPTSYSKREAYKEARRLEAKGLVAKVVKKHIGIEDTPTMHNRETLDSRTKLDSIIDNLTKDQQGE